MVLDRAGDEDDPLAQQPRKDVEAALAPVGLLDDDWDELRSDILVVDHGGEILAVCWQPTSGGSRQGSSGPSCFCGRPTQANRGRQKKGRPGCPSRPPLF